MNSKIKLRVNLIIYISHCFQGASAVLDSVRVIKMENG